MDALKQQLLKVQQQLAGLSASQKMLTASLLVIMVMTLFYWSNVAGRSEMEAVIDGQMTPDEMAAVQTAARAKHVKYEVRDDKVFVPAGQREEFAAAMSDLAYNGSLPAAYNKADDDTDTGFGFKSEAVRQSQLQERRRRRVEGMIAHWPGVRSAQVILAGERSTGIMRDSAPTASVSIDTKPNGDGAGGVDAKKTVLAARRLVLGAQPGITDKDIQVIVNGTPFDAANPDAPFGGSDAQFAAKKEGEAYLQGKLRTQLRYIENVQTSVIVKLNTSDVTTEEHRMDAKNTITATKHETTSEESTPLPPSSGEPGATTNLTVTAEPSASPEQAAATKNTREKTNEVLPSYTDTKTKNAGGDVSAVTAVVGVPESYFRKVWIAKNSLAKRDPKDEEVAAVMNEYLPKIREMARLAVNIVDPKNVQVDTYFDLDAAPVADPTAGAGLAALPTGSGFGAKEIAIGALAVISLFMVSMMVRKSAPQPVLAGIPAGPMNATEAMPDHHALLTVGEVIGEVGEGGMTMAGHELSPEEITAKQVIEQVGTMVKANPDVAADLVKRWLDQD